MAGLKTLLKGLLGGGSAYIYLLVAGALFGFYIHYEDIKGDLVEAKASITRLEGEVTAANSNTNSLANTAERRKNQGEQDDEDERVIKNTKDSDRCSNSEPIIAALGGMRREWESRNKTGDTDK